MKYNIGDKIVKLRLDYICNIYHYKLTIHIETVKFANKSYFSEYKKAEKSFQNGIAGIDQYMFYFQNDGRQWNYPKPDTYYHFEKDYDLICEKINEAIQDCKLDIHRKKEKEIQDIENRIKYLESRIEEIKTGKYIFDNELALSKSIDLIKKSGISPT